MGGQREHGRSEPGRYAVGHGPEVHSHLWVLPDGTGLHAPPGDVTVDEDTGRLCCHLCGRWFVSLGSHVRVHGHTADSYRQGLGLCTGTPLTAEPLSTVIATRQALRHRRDPDLREILQIGRTVRTAPSTRPAPSPAPVEPAQRVRRRRSALATGRATRARHRRRQLALWLAERGHPTLHDYLRTAYAGGASLEDLARATGLGRDRLRQEVSSAGITVRLPGSNTGGGKRSRAQAADAVAATRVGTQDVLTWLAVRRAEGWSLTRLAAAVGHSTHWVRWRLPAQEPAHLTAL